MLAFWILVKSCMFFVAAENGLIDQTQSPNGIRTKSNTGANLGECSCSFVYIDVNTVLNKTYSES